MFGVQTIKNAAKVAKFKVVEAKPELMLGAGIVAVVAGTVWACIKTKEAQEVVEDLKADNEAQKEAEGDQGIDISARAKLYGSYAWRFVKIYGLPALAWVTGMGCIVGSHGEMRSRNAKLLANSVALKSLFDEYRKRVAEEFGDEVEKRLYFGTKEQEIDIHETDEQGNKKTRRAKADVFPKESGSMYARNFTKKTSFEFDARTYVDYFLDSKMAQLNNKLKTVPFLTLNDIYDELGFKPGCGRCPEGMTVGWVWDPKIDRGDREIIFTRMKGWEACVDPNTGREYYEPCLRLDFNCYPLEGLI